MGDLHTLPLIGSLLKRLGVESHEDIASIDLKKVRGMNGVGRLKYKAIKKLYEDACGKHVSEETMIENQKKRNVPAEHADQRLDQISVKFPKRVQDRIDEKNIITISDLEMYLSGVDISTEENFGRRSYSSAVTLLDTFYQNPDKFSVPKFHTVHEMILHFIANIPEQRSRNVVEGWYLRGKTLQEIGDEQSPKITRERIRQIANITITTHASRYRGVARELLQPLFVDLDRGCGVVIAKSGSHKVGAVSTQEIILAASMIGVDLYCHRSVTEECISDLDQIELKGKRRELAQYFGYGSGTHDLNFVAKKMSELGYDFSPEESVEYISHFLNIKLENGRIHTPGRESNVFFEECMREHGSTATATQFADYINNRYSDLDISPHLVAVHFGRSHKIFKVNEHDYIHEDNYPVSRDVLDMVAKSVMDLLPEDGGAESVKKLLKKVDTFGCEVNPFSVRDIMIKTKKVRGWRSTCDAALICATTHRNSLNEVLKKASFEIEQPFSNDELRSLASSEGSFADASIMAQISSLPELSLYSVGHSFHIEAVFGSQKKYQEVMEELYLSLDNQNPVSCATLNVNHPKYAGYVKKHGEHILWAVIKDHPDVNYRILGNLVWHKSLGTDLMALVFKDFNRDEFFSYEFTKHVFDKFRVRNRQFCHTMVRDAVKAGVISIRPGTDLYVRN